MGLGFTQDVADAARGAPLHAQAKHHAGAFGLDAIERLTQRVLAPPADLVEQLVEHGGRLHAHERGRVGRDLALHKGEVLDVVDIAAVDNHVEVAELERHVRLGVALDELLFHAAILDQIRHRHDHESEALGHDFEIRTARHGAVLVHDLADDAGGSESRQPCQIDRALGLPGALEHAAGLGNERKHVARTRQVFGAAVLAHGSENRRRTVGRADAGGHALARLNRNGEGSGKLRGVVLDHGTQVELAGLLVGQGQADEPAPVGGHEVDGLGRDLLGGVDEVTLVLTVLVVDEDDGLSLANVFNGLLYTRKRHGGVPPE